MARGSIRKAGEAWQIVYDLPEGVDGNRRQKRKSGFRTRREAEKALAKALAAVASGAYRETHSVNLGAHLTEWLAHRESHLTYTTYRAHASIVRAHLIPALGELPLARLTVRDVDRYLHQKRTDGALAEKTLRRHFAVLSAALKQAVRWGLILQNPCELVDAPSGRSEKRPPLAPDELRGLLEAVEDDWLRLPILLAVGTGMRLGEICGLRWQDVHLERGILTVQQSLSAFRDGEPVFSACKTEQSQRRLPLPPFLLATLIRQRGEQAAHRLLHADLWIDSGLVLTNERGAPRNPDVVSHRYTRLKRRLGLTPTFHDLRHGHATLLLLAGTHPKKVQAQLGHASIRQTMDTYSHLIEGVGEEDVSSTVELGMRGLLRETG